MISSAVRRLVPALLLVAVVATPFPAVAAGTQIQLRPTSGPGGTSVQVRGQGFDDPDGCPFAVIDFFDVNGAVTPLSGRIPVSSGRFHKTVVIPVGAAVGVGSILARQPYRSVSRGCVGHATEASQSFTVTGT